MSGLATKNAAYEEALSYLYGRIDYERSSSIPQRFHGVHLDRMSNLLELVGDPHKRLRAVHLAGTKGKGSTAGMISSMLLAANYSVGLYTSPHLHRLEERLMVDGQPCRQSELVHLVAVIRPAVEVLDSANSGPGPTFFEITTALAMLHFVERSVDVAVLEVGMGGRLDSTNVCEPIVSVITSISLDHTKQLGNTLSAIAREKAGIIKPGIPVISGVELAEPRDVVRDVARSRECPLTELGTDFTFSYAFPDLVAEHNPLATFSYRGQHDGLPVEYDDVQLPLLGKHQAANAAVAIAAANQLQQAGFTLPERAIREGLLQARIPARIEVVSRRPTVVLDTAHNVASVEALTAVLSEFPPAPRRTLIFATTVDKDVSGMLTRLAPHFDCFILTRYQNNPRGVDPIKLASLTEAATKDQGLEHRQIQVCDDPLAAWEAYRGQSRIDDLVCIAGSFFLAESLRAVLVAQTGDQEALKTFLEP